MKALTEMEMEFEALLDAYCTAVESGNAVDAAVAAYYAGESADAVDLLKTVKVPGQPVATIQQVAPRPAWVTEDYVDAAQ